MFDSKSMMTTNNKSQPKKGFLYQTKDPGLAAALMALGFELIKLEERDRAFYFAFPASPMVFEAAKAYEEGTLSVSAKRMSEAMQVLEIAVWDQRDLEKL